MWTPSYDIIVETLTGSEFEVTVNDRDTVGYLKAEIQKYEGIPVSQQHLLYKHKELSDAMEMKDIPLVKGSRVKLVLGMKGGPISSKRLFTISSDYDNWLDMSDVFSGDDLINLQSPGLKLLLYKDNKKNVHRLMKVRAEKAGDGMKGSSLSRSVIGSGAGQGGHATQREREAAITKQKMDQIKAKLSMKKKRLGVAEGGGEEAGACGLQNAGEQQAMEDRQGRSEASGLDVECKLIARNQGQYRHKKRHHHHHQHYHHTHHNHHHHHHHPQHETVIKEEKTPIGYRPGATSGSGRGSGGGATALVATAGHSSPMVGAIGSMLPAATATGAATATTGAHRKSMPAVIDIGRQEQESAAAPFSYGLVNLMHGGGGGGSTATASATTTRAPPALELEKRSQIREHLQRNRSFKTISAKNLDFNRDCSHMPGMGGGGGRCGLGGGHGGSAGLERSLSFHSNGILNRMNSESTLDDAGSGSSGVRRCANLGHARGAGIGQSRISADATTQSLHHLDEKSSASLHDLIELLKYTQSKQQRTISNDSLNKLVLNYSKKMYLPHAAYHNHHHGANGSVGTKTSTLPDINPSLKNIDEYLPNFDVDALHGVSTAAESAGAIPKGIISRTGADDLGQIASAEIAFKNPSSSGADKTTYRTLCKSISDDSSVYELPKLLVREDSPVESFLASYSQLETVALRGDTPKNNFTSTSSLQEVAGVGGGGGGGGLLDDPHGTTAAAVSESLLELRPIATKSPAVASALVTEAKRASESLLQLAQIAAESVKSCSVTPPAAAAINDISPQPSGGQLFATNVCTASVGAGGGICDATSSTSSSSWCQHWNQRQQQQHQQQQDLYSSNLQELQMPRRHHHSDLGINELELKFVRADSLDRVGGDDESLVLRGGGSGGAGGGDSSGSVIKLPAIPNLEINTGWLSSGGCWDTLRFGREDEDADDEGLDEDEIGGVVNEHEEDGDEEPEEDEVDDREERLQTASSSSCSSIQRPRRATSNSTSFIHSHLSISSDEDDLLSVAHELGGGGAGGGAAAAAGGGIGSGRSASGASCSAYKPGSNKSKSIDLNEFRKAFGSSPTLLNGFAAGVGTSCTRLVPQLSRLETIPSQYRRGYTNLNDACLSSSTSELECVSNGAAKKKNHLNHHHHHAGVGGGLLPPGDDRNALSSSTLLNYRNKSGNIPYVRSNENLNRYKGSSMCCSTAPATSGGASRRRSGDSSIPDATAVGTLGDALYLRQRTQQQSTAAMAGGGSSTTTAAPVGYRHLPGIRDHLASIADSELSDSFDGGSSSNNSSTHNSTGSNLNEDDEANRGGLTLLDGGDFECRFSRLSCCADKAAPPNGGSSQSVSPPGGDAMVGVNGLQNHHQQQQQAGLSAIGSGASAGHRSATAASSTERNNNNNRLLFGDEGRSSMPRFSVSDGGGTGTSTTATTTASNPLRPLDYYFPSDESLFNMDSFFDDFVEIDTSDIFDSTEYININAPGTLGGRKSSSHGGSLLLPDIHGQQQQQHHGGEQLQHQKTSSSSSSQYLYFQTSKDQRVQDQQQRRILHTPPPGFRSNGYEDQILKCSTRYAFMHAGGGNYGDHVDDDDDDEDDVDDDDDDDDEDDEDDDEEDEEEEGIASIIQHIDREQLCDEPRLAATSSATAAATAVSSSIVTVHANSGKRHSASSERLLRLLSSQLPPHRSHSSAKVTLPSAEALPNTTTGEPLDCATTSTTTTTDATDSVLELSAGKGKKLRCAHCNKKLGMVMIMKCHCEKVFCAQHRYAEAHNCSYDFKLEGRKVLEKNNPLVVADKLPKI